MSCRCTVYSSSRARISFFPTQTMKETLLPLIWGQVLSLILSGAYIFNQLVNEIGVYSSLFPNEVMYFLLFLVCLPQSKFIFTLYKNTSANNRFWAFMLGAIDVLANTCMLKAFEYTSGVSAVLISSTSCIFTVPLAIIFLKAKYNIVHGGGILLAICGLVCINLSKYKRATDTYEDTNFDLTGTMLAVIAALGFASCSVIQTKIISKIDNHDSYPWAALATYGFGSLLLSVIISNGTEFGRQDRDSWILSDSPQKYFLCGLVICSTLFYLATPIYLQRFSAINFQMSILTADIGVYIFNVFYLKVQLSPLYVVGFFIVLMGLGIFNLGFMKHKDIAALEEVSQD